jgi:hypothetical protein
LHLKFWCKYLEMGYFKRGGSSITLLKGTYFSLVLLGTNLDGENDPLRGSQLPFEGWLTLLKKLFSGGALGLLYPQIL